mgnify:CR=1 FL=1
MAKVKIEGIEVLQKQLKKNMSKDEVKRLIRSEGAKLQGKAMREADFKGHYEWEAGKGMVFKPQTGNLRRNIQLDIVDGGMTAEVYSTAEYAPYVELGTRFMEAQPYLKPALEKQKSSFQKEMRKLVK